MLADIMQLVQTVDVEKMVQEVRDAGDAANLDSMIATVTKKMLGQMQGGGARDEACVRVTLAEAFNGKRRRVRVRHASGEHRDVACVVPAGCPDGHAIAVGAVGAVGGADAPVELVVRVAECESGVRRDAEGNAFTAVRVSLGETRALRCALRMPWGETVELDEVSDAPLVGWVCVKGAGMRDLQGDRADLYVHLELVLPESWAAVERLADVPPLNAPAPNGTQPKEAAPKPNEAPRRVWRVSRLDERALAKCKAVPDVAYCPTGPTAASTTS